MLTLAINPGSTSTKIAVFEDLNEKFSETLRHSSEELSKYDSLFDQYDFRKKIIIDFLKSNGLSPQNLDAVVGRGGLLKPIPGGVYRVNNAMIDDLKHSVLGEHASNLGGVLAKEISKEMKNRENAFIVDPVVVDELDNVARFSGRPELPRISIFHALNQKAVGRRYAREVGTRYSNLNLIIVHLGGGITVGAHKNGRVIDVNNGLDGEGPFSPERAGTVPVGSLVKLCYSGKFQMHELKKMLVGKGGIVSYLNTNNAIEVEKKIEKGDVLAKRVYEAMAYQISKEIGCCATVLCGKVDAILLTGGLAYSDMLVDWISERVKFIGPIKIFPGEDEMIALVENVFYALKGDLPIKEYV